TTQSNTDGSHTNMFVMRLDQNADVIWARTYGTTNANSQGVRVFNKPGGAGGGFIAVGTSSSGGAGFEDGWVVDLDDSGHIHNQLLIGRQFYDDGRFFTFTNNLIVFGGVAGRIGG